MKPELVLDIQGDAAGEAVTYDIVLGPAQAWQIASRVVAEAFDSLDAPVLRVGSKDGIAPQAYSLEDAFLPHDRDIVAAVKKLL